MRIAVTGGIGSGKSAVTEYLTEKGFCVLDADAMAREMTGPGGKAIPYITVNFGQDYIASDGSMDRAKMAAKVYGDEKSMHILEAGTTELVEKDIENMMCEKERAGCRAVFADIPLLFEKKGQDRFDRVWLVVADRSTRLRRVAERDGRKESDIVRIMDCQMPDERKIRLSDEVIENNGSMAELHEKIDGLLEKYKLQNI